MALSNLFGWKKSETEAGSACGAACGAADKPGKAQIVRGTIALSGPERSVDNQQRAEQHVEQQTSREEKSAACGTVCGASDK